MPHPSSWAMTPHFFLHNFWHLPACNAGSLSIVEKRGVTHSSSCLENTGGRSRGGGVRAGQWGSRGGLTDCRGGRDQLEAWLGCDWGMPGGQGAGRARRRLSAAAWACQELWRQTHPPIQLKRQAPFPALPAPGCSWLSAAGQAQGCRGQGAEPGCPGVGARLGFPKTA